MEQLGKRDGGKVEQACPGCWMPRTEWPDAGVVVNGTSYCCMGCAHGLGCTCQKTNLKKKPTKSKE